MEEGRKGAGESSNSDTKACKGVRDHRDATEERARERHRGRLQNDESGQGREIVVVFPLMGLCNGVTRHRYGLAPASVLVPARVAGAISPYSALERCQTQT